MELNYNKILKLSCDLIKGVKYEEVYNIRTFAIIVYRDNILIASNFVTKDFNNFNIDIVRESLSKILVLNIFRKGLGVCYNEISNNPKLHNQLNSFKQYLLDKDKEIEV